MLDLPREIALDLGGGVKLECVLIPAGKFMMGSPAGEEGRLVDETPHEVTISRAFYMGRYAVTQEQFEKVMGTNPSKFVGSMNPVDQVAWIHAQEFCRKVSELTGKIVRLPTEAEWEHACRAGTRTRFYTGDAVADLDRAGWYEANSGDTTHPVGRKAPNAWGLYDMLGNVWEWCQDWHGAYPAEAVIDPQGVAKSDDRVLRGGAWCAPAERCRPAYRFKFHHEFVYYVFRFGFRVAVTAPETP